MTTSMQIHCISPRDTIHRSQEVRHCLAVIDLRINISLVVIRFCDIRIQISARTSWCVIETIGGLRACKCFCERESAEGDSVVDKRAVVDTSSSTSMRKNNAWGECDVGVVFNHSPITGKGVFGAIEERGPSEVRVPERPVPVSRSLLVAARI